MKYSGRKRKTKLEGILEFIEGVIPWDKLVALISSYVSLMLRKVLL
ncbi:MAG: hypothetical protein LIO54_04895 [Oscillospiraceae bacterium]|nr:hypothetical protein [Oscillospiraceae bacterium]